MVVEVVMMVLVVIVEALLIAVLMVALMVSIEKLVEAMKTFLLIGSETLRSPAHWITEAIDFFNYLCLLYPKEWKRKSGGVGQLVGRDSILRPDITFDNVHAVPKENCNMATRLVPRYAYDVAF
ncbi:hypothetical protein PoB_000114300 [Plakobranchus ocellatus]|uniref:Uncharacterized protein n=1 Tax=Plakobranchus ocellatus TaxID=259542 RepID=A0AAV3XWJ0_9GAST|nr:hypothetical protein PoB_000114300 [Plakobranchus ocellatus]